MQYKIPQNVDVEDKIFGPLTLRQFIWLIVGGFFTFIIYLLLARVALALFIFAALPVAAVFTALAFFRVNERPLELFIVSSFRSFFRPRRRIWMRIPEPHLTAAPAPEPAAATPVYKPGVEEVRSQLENLTMVVDTRGWGREAPESAFLSGGRIVSAPEERAVEPEPPDPAEQQSAGLDQALEEAAARVTARIRSKPKPEQIKIADDPSKEAFEAEVLHQQTRPPVARYGSPEEMRQAMQSFGNSGGGV